MKTGIALTPRARRSALWDLRHAHDSATEMLHFTRRAHAAKTADTASRFEQRAFEWEQEMRDALHRVGAALGDEIELHETIK